MKYKLMPILFFIPLLLCSCSLSNSSPSETKEDTIMEMSATYDSQLIVGPVNELTLENQIKVVERSYKNVCNSYSKMQELANAEGISEEGKQAVMKIEENYSERIEELANTDFSLLSSEELFSLSIELSNIITEIRGARDSLTLYH